MLAGTPVEFELRFLLLVLVGLGVVAEMVGIHAIMGLILSGIVQDHGTLGGKLKGVVFSASSRPCSSFAPARRSTCGPRIGTPAPW